MESKHDNDEEFVMTTKKVSECYKKAPERKKEGINTTSIDEKTGIQALETKIYPMEIGKVERREFEYIRHGTLCLTANFDVATGNIITPTIEETRTEEDFVQHIDRLIESDPEAKGWIFVTDQLNTHKSEGIVRLIAEKCGITEELGEKGKKGVLKNMETRKNFLEDESHPIRFLFTPKHCSWLNQIEIWFGILVKKLLKRGSFISKENLKQKIYDFIEYFNKTMAKPFKWTFDGLPLKYN